MVRHKTPSITKHNTNRISRKHFHRQTNNIRNRRERNSRHRIFNPSIPVFIISNRNNILRRIRRRRKHHITNRIPRNNQLSQNRTRNKQRLRNSSQRHLSRNIHKILRRLHTSLLHNPHNRFHIRNKHFQIKRNKPSHRRRIHKNKIRQQRNIRATNKIQLPRNRRNHKPLRRILHTRKPNSPNNISPLQQFTKHILVSRKNSSLQLNLRRNIHNNNIRHNLISNPKLLRPKRKNNPNKIRNGRRGLFIKQYFGHRRILSNRHLRKHGGILFRDLSMVLLLV